MSNGSLVQVLTDDGAWCTGSLRRWDRRAGAWYALVVFVAVTGETRLGWFPADRLRPLVPQSRKADESAAGAGRVEG